MLRHEQQQNYEAAQIALSKQLNALSGVLLSITAHGDPIPCEVAIELQHMLVHLLLASEDAIADYTTRTSQLGHALGHLDRAMLDACKILIEKNFPHLSQNIGFMRQWIDLRQREGRDHFRGQSSFNINSTCDSFSKLLRDHNLLTESAAASTTPRPLVGEWCEYLKELTKWFQRELLYSSLCGKKSWDALNGMLQSFWTLDTDKLQVLNNRLELDILLTNYEHSITLGWTDNKDFLKNHKDFISQYICGQCSDEEIKQNYSSWICRAFTSLIRFYGQPWND